MISAAAKLREVLRRITEGVGNVSNTINRRISETADDIRLSTSAVGRIDIDHADRIRKIGGMADASTGRDSMLSVDQSPVPMPNTDDIVPSPLVNTVSNLSDDMDATLKNFPEGAAFSGVYNRDSKTFLALPSGDTRYTNGPWPPNIVPRTEGHLYVNAKFCEITGAPPSESVGFSFVVHDDGTLGTRWKSTSVNRKNPEIDYDWVPEDWRSEIEDALKGATGRDIVFRHH